MGSSEEQKKQFLQEVVMKALSQTTPKWEEIRAQINRTLSFSTVLKEKKKNGTWVSLLSVCTERERITES